MPTDRRGLLGSGTVGQAKAYDGPPYDWQTVTVDPNTDLLEIGVAIRCDAATNLTVDMPGGLSRVMRFLAGETRYGIFTRIRAQSGTANIEVAF